MFDRAICGAMRLREIPTVSLESLLALRELLRQINWAGVDEHDDHPRVEDVARECKEDSGRPAELIQAQTNDPLAIDPDGSASRSGATAGSASSTTRSAEDEETRGER